MCSVGAKDKDADVGVRAGKERAHCCRASCVSSRISLAGWEGWDAVGGGLEVEEEREKEEADDAAVDSDADTDENADAKPMGPTPSIKKLIHPSGFPATTGWDPITSLGTPNSALRKAAVGL
ncbi:hypothetical protein B0H13DRAFT_2364909 [Mycena leptocephala]|nr:hypothetical protein B0H13DRAFT_2364909 [Mycena leptocephala]